MVILAMQVCVSGRRSLRCEGAARFAREGRRSVEFRSTLRAAIGSGRAYSRRLPGINAEGASDQLSLFPKTRSRTDLATAC